MVERQPTMTCRILIGLTRIVSERLQTASLEMRQLNRQLGEQRAKESIET